MRNSHACLPNRTHNSVFSTSGSLPPAGVHHIMYMWYTAVALPLHLHVCITALFTLCTMHMMHTNTGYGRATKRRVSVATMPFAGSMSMQQISRLRVHDPHGTIPKKTKHVACHYTQAALQQLRWFGSFEVMITTASCFRLRWCSTSTVSSL